ncbi:MAG: GAF domain-containing sensor histidine kinase [Anaerolineae bacterium]|nr:GAF domain-containing sensor histidine kinase [Anaerolineae bacterium]
MSEHDAPLTLAQYQRLIEISLDLASMLDLDALLKRIMLVAEEISESEAASILLWDEREKQLYFQGADNPKKNENLFLGIVVPAESLAGWVALNRQPVIVEDAHTDTRWFKNVEKEAEYPTHSLIAVPLIAKDKLVGVLEVLNRRQGVYDQRDLSALTVLAAQAAVAIENTRLFQQSDLIAELIHEFRQPLSAIITIGYLLQRPELSDQQRKGFSETIVKEARRLDDLSTKFLDLARLESGRAVFQNSRIQVEELIKECYELTKPRAEESGIQLCVEISSSLPVIHADRDKVKQVLLNLISNAIKYNRSGGKVTIQGCAEDNELVLSVSDTGQGIAAEDLPHLFGKFFRAKSGEGTTVGTGLGLSICKKIVENMGGKIEVQSEVGVGSTFAVHLPVEGS